MKRLVTESSTKGKSYPVDHTSKDHSGAIKISMWTNKEQIAEHEGYVHGRNLVGKAFVEIFATQNPWAVKDLDFGLNPTHGAKLGKALELIVTCSTKPQVINVS